jgi:serine/threonine protein kinase
MEAYKVGAVIGSGSYGEVRLAVEKASGKKCAVKTLQKSQIADVSEVERVSQEFFILTSLDHRNVIRLYEVTQDDAHLYIVQEYAAGGSLEQHLTKLGGRCPDEREARKLFTQILSAVRYCHRKRVVHRDLKPDNILLSNGQVKVCDFGLSLTVAYGSRARSPVGTPLYAAPEVLFPQQYPDLDSAGDEGMGGRASPHNLTSSARSDGSSSYSVEEGGEGGARPVRAQYSAGVADVWSLGCILHRLHFGRLPYPAETMRELKRALFEGEWAPPGPCSPALERLLRVMLNKDPRTRMSAEDVSAHAWTAAGGVGALPSLQVEEEVGEGEAEGLTSPESLVMTSPRPCPPSPSGTPTAAARTPVSDRGRPPPTPVHHDSKATRGRREVTQAAPLRHRDRSPSPSAPPPIECTLPVLSSGIIAAVAATEETASPALLVSPTGFHASSSAGFLLVSPTGFHASSSAGFLASSSSSSVVHGAGRGTRRASITQGLVEELAAMALGEPAQGGGHTGPPGADGSMTENERYGPSQPALPALAHARTEDERGSEATLTSSASASAFLTIAHAAAGSAMSILRPRQSLGGNRRGSLVGSIGIVLPALSLGSPPLGSPPQAAPAGKAALISPAGRRNSLVKLAGIKSQVEAEEAPSSALSSAMVEGGATRRSSLVRGKLPALPPLELPAHTPGGGSDRSVRSDKSLENAAAAAVAATGPDVTALDVPGGRVAIAPLPGYMRPTAGTRRRSLPGVMVPLPQ